MQWTSESWSSLIDNTCMRQWQHITTVLKTFDILCPTTVKNSSNYIQKTKTAVFMAVSVIHTPKPESCCPHISSIAYIPVWLLVTRSQLHIHVFRKSLRALILTAIQFAVLQPAYNKYFGDSGLRINLSDFYRLLSSLQNFKDVGEKLVSFREGFGHSATP